MHVLIVGAGAVGCFVGGRLAQGSAAVTLVGRAPLMDAIRQRGLLLDDGHHARNVTNLTAVTSLAEAFQNGNAFDLGIVAVKGYDTAAAIRELQAATASPPPLLSLQNGVGHEDTLAAACGAERIVAGALTVPVSFTAPGVVRAYRRGRLLAAPWGRVAPVGLLQRLADHCLSGGLPFWMEGDGRSLKWRKLLMNLITNATCAILDQPPGRLLADRRMATLEIWAWHEAVAVLRASGIAIRPLAGYPLPLLARAVTALSPSQLYWPFRWLVAGSRGGKLPSLQVDLGRGKTASEVTWLNGAVAAQGQRVGVPTPINGLLTERLSAIVGGEVDWARYRGQPDALWREAMARRTAPPAR